MSDLHDKARKLAEKIHAEVMKNASKGLNAGRIFIAARIKETLNVPAPRKLVRLPNGERMYRATTPAVKGAPPRRVSGRYRNSVTSAMLSDTEAVIGASAHAPPSARYPEGFNYPLHHEETNSLHPTSGQHQAFKPTVERYRQELTTIVGAPIKLTKLSV